METTCPFCGKRISAEIYYYQRHVHECSNRAQYDYNNNGSMSDDNDSYVGNCNPSSSSNSSLSSKDELNESERSKIGNIFHELNVGSECNIHEDSSIDSNAILTNHDDKDDDITDIEDYNFSSLITNNVEVEDECVIHPFEAISLKFFKDNDIPISLFEEYIRIFLVGKKMNYSPSRDTTTYKYLVNKLKASKRFTRHEYVTKKIKVYENISVNIRVFPFVDNVKWLLIQKDLMHDSNWKFDPSSNVYSELNTGSWWRNAEERLLHRTRNSKQDLEHLLIPIIAFIDKTHCTNKGTINAEPVLISIGNISINIRKNPKAWFNLGYIPSKILTKAERDELKKGPGTRSTLTEIYHTCLKVIFGDILEIEKKDYSTNEGMKLFVYGKGWVYGHFELSMIIGDALGHDQLCCHYQGYSSQVQRPMRMCCCSYDDLDNPLVVCKPVIAEKVNEIVSACIQAIHNKRKKTTARSVAKSISQELHVSSFSMFNCGGDEEGIYGITPVECLHALLLGIMMYVLKCLFEYKVESVKEVDGVKEQYLKKIFRTSEFERRIRILSKYSKRQSYRHIPRSTYTNGVCTLSGLSGQELVGLSVLSIIALPGCINIESANDQLCVERDFSELLWLGVSLYESFQSYSIPKDEGNMHLETKVRYYIKRFCDVCGEQRNIQSEVGTKLTKLHSLIHLVKAIPKYGTPMNYFGGYMEKNLKSFVKYPSKRTRMMSGDPFLLDLSNRWSEFSIIDDYYYTPSLEHEYLFNDNKKKTVPSDNIDMESRLIWGKEQFRFQVMNGQWYTIYKDVSGSVAYERGIFHPYYKLPNIVLSALKDWVTNEIPNYIESIGKHPTFISCHYNVKDNINSCSEECQIYRSSPSYRGENWFDWVNIEYNDDNDLKYSVPAKTFLWMKVCFDNTDVYDNDFVLGWPLSSLNLKEYPLFKHLRCDELYDTAEVFSVANSLRGVAYVLPCVNVDNDLGTHGDEMNRKRYLNDPNEKFYMSIPCREHWPSIGWTSDCYERFKEQWYNVMDVTINDSTSNDSDMSTN